jgi:proline iminopeptidase
MEQPAQDPDLYPALEPYMSARLPAGGAHAIYYEQSGNPAGFPALFLHGGPGSRTRAQHRRYFDPACYRIVLHDQRGCGKSEPLGATAANTTSHLVEDIEALRAHLGLERVLLFGGSWGSTLALAYAAAHPARVAGLVLRGVFLASRAEIDWYVEGLRRFVPRAWEALAQGAGERLVERYHAEVNDRDADRALAAARRWVRYEEAVMSLGAQAPAAEAEAGTEETLARARVQLHYLAHECFLAPDDLAAGLARLAQVPALIVQGALDMVCPPRTAFEVARALPRAELRLIARGGHSASEPEMARELRRATDDMRGMLR